MPPALIDENRSLWAADATAPPRPPLRGDVVADVAIIGGGFTGVSTAWHLRRRFPDLGIVLLEAGRLAGGASGRSGGQVLNWINGVSWADPDVTRRVYATTKGAIDDLFALIEAEGLPVRRTRRGAAEVYTFARNAEDAHREAEKLQGWGIPVQYLRGQALADRIRLTGGKGAIYDPSAGQINGVDLILAQADRLSAQGVAFYERSPVQKVEEGPKIRLTTPEGAVTAGSVVLATNGYTPRLGYFRGGILALHSHVLGTAPLTLEQRDALGIGDLSGFSDDRDRIAYGSLTPAGELVFGGGSNAAYGYRYGNATAWEGSAERGFAAVQATLRACFPGAADLPVARRWTGTLGVTLSRRCGMGVMGDHRNVYYALGYSGHGITLATLAGRVLCDLYAGDHDPWKDLPFYQYRPGGIPPEPLRYVGYHVYTSLTGRSPRRVG